MCVLNLEIRNVVRLGRSDHVGVEGIGDHRALVLNQLFVRERSCLNDPVGVVEHEAEVANTTDARVEARRRLTGLQAWVAENAILRLPSESIIVYTDNQRCTSAGRGTSPG